MILLVRVLGKAERKNKCNRFLLVSVRRKQMLINFPSLACQLLTLGKKIISVVLKVSISISSGF